MDLAKIEFVDIDFNTVKADPFSSDDPSSIDTNRTKCAEVFTENSTDFTLICTHCKDIHTNLIDFGEHLRSKHIVVKEEIKIEEETKPNYEDTSDVIDFEEVDDSFEADDSSTDEETSNEHPAFPKEVKTEKKTAPKVTRKYVSQKRKDREKSAVFFRCEKCLRLYSTKKYLKHHICKPKKTQTPKDVRREEANVIVMGPVAEQKRQEEEELKAQAALEAKLKAETEKKEKKKSGRKKLFTQAELYCDICDQTFSRIYRFRSHALKHDTMPTALKNSPDFMKCRLCKLTFTQLPEWRKHLETHTQDNLRFGCTLCPKRFTERIVLQMHMNTHTGERPYMCDRCPMAFAHATNLSWHMKRVHLKLTPYACKLCDKKFTKNYELTVHMRNHTGEKPYVCEECGKGFIMSGRLNDHRRTHGTLPGRVRKHRCELCPKTFKTKVQLVSHRQLHADNML